MRACERAHGDLASKMRACTRASAREASSATRARTARVLSACRRTQAGSCRSLPAARARRNAADNLRADARKLRGTAVPRERARIRAHVRPPLVPDAY